jgi:hypothetical protein
MKYLPLPPVPRGEGNRRPSCVYSSDERTAGRDVSPLRGGYDKRSLTLAAESSGLRCMRPIPARPSDGPRSAALST